MTAPTSPEGNVLSSLSGVLDRLGVLPATQRTTVAEATGAALSKRDLRAHFVGARYNSIELDADATQARLINYDSASLLAEINSGTGESFVSIRVRVRRV